MFPCPNCGDNLRFDIASQKMSCRSCDSFFAIDDIDKENQSTENSQEEKEFFETTIFYCPQCGGEMIGDETDATMVCSYCGSSNVLETRLGKEKRPNYIIPFKIGKEECKKRFLEKMSKSFWADKEYRSVEKIESFRALYVPYYSYRIGQDESVSVPTEKSHRSGNYIITDHYRVRTHIRAKYLGLSKDASSSFYDNISESLEPFDVKETVPFKTQYLSGFYADIADVPSIKYQEEVKDIACGNTADVVMKAVAGANAGSPTNGNVSVKSNIEGVDMMMYPVWFLSYRVKDRIAYATVNGQTGKVATDVPISIPKFVGISLIASVVWFAILNALFTFKPAMLLALVSLLMAFAMSMYYSEIKDIFIKENNIGDKGVLAAKKEEQRELEKMVDYKEKKKKKKAIGKLGQKKKTGRWVPIMLVIYLVVVVGEGALTVLFGIFQGSFLQVIIAVVAIIWTLICFFKNYNMGYIEPGQNVLPVVLLLTECVAFLMTMMNLHVDEVYYFYALGMLGVVIVTLLVITRKLVDLTTRPLPQFKKSGGDDSGI